VCNVCSSGVVCVAVLQRVAMCCSVMQCDAVCSKDRCTDAHKSGSSQHYSVLQYVAVCCSALQFVAVRCSV